MNSEEKKQFEELKVSIADLTSQTKIANNRSQKVYERVFEDNGDSLISEVRWNKQCIVKIEDSIKNIGKTGKIVMGKDTGDIWRYGIRFATILAYIAALILGIDFTFIK